MEKQDTLDEDRQIREDNQNQKSPASKFANFVTKPPYNLKVAGSSSSSNQQSAV